MYIEESESFTLPERKPTMTRDELIEKEAKRHSPIPENCSAIISISITAERAAYKAGINSDLNKDLQELAVIDGKIEIMLFNKREINFSSYYEEEKVDVILKGLRTARKTLLTKLNLER